MSVKPFHPIWGQAIWFTLNIEQEKSPDILDDAVTLRQIKDSSVDGIYSSHTIEHVDYALSVQMFRNWCRVLKPGGRIEIRCPDVEWTWKEYFSGRLPEAIVTELIMGIRVGPYEVHRNLWWESKLTNELHTQGFVNARRIDYGFIQPSLDFWLYDGTHSEHHGFQVIDLLVEAYKPIDSVPEARVNTQKVQFMSPSHSAVWAHAKRWTPYQFRALVRRLRSAQQRNEARNMLRSIQTVESTDTWKINSP